MLFVSPTEHNMQIDDSLTLINELDPDYIFPQHRDTYPVTHRNPHTRVGRRSLHLL